MSDSENSPQATVNFFRNYNRVVGVAFLAIVLLTLGFFLHQINEKRKEELAIIVGHVERHSQFIEFVFALVPGLPGNFAHCRAQSVS